MSNNLSIILPAKNEAAALKILLPKIKKMFCEAEIIVVNDGSVDDTVDACKGIGVLCVSHPYSKGNGAAIKTGARQATNKVLIFMDADGQHLPEDIPYLLEKLSAGYDMAVGARSGNSQASIFRGIGNKFYNFISSWMVGQKIDDLTSGFRAVNAEKFHQFIYLLPNGFSYPTTITMSFFRAGYSVGYVPIHAQTRIGNSHLRVLKDGLRFLLIIFKIGSLYSPLKLFAPIAAFHFSVGLGYYVYTFMNQSRLSSMSVFMFSTAVTIFMIGLVSEQITALIYKDSTAQK